MTNKNETPRLLNDFKFNFLNIQGGAHNQNLKRWLYSSRFAKDARIGLSRSEDTDGALFMSESILSSCYMITIRWSHRMITAFLIQKRQL